MMMRKDVTKIGKIGGLGVKNRIRSIGIIRGLISIKKGMGTIRTKGEKGEESWG